MRIPLPRTLLCLTALTLAGVLLSGCAFFKDGSLQLSQPVGIGSVRVHFELCSVGEGEAECEPSDEEGQQGQQLLGFAVPAGATAPATITAAPKAGGAQPIVYTRNDQVGAALVAEAEGTPETPWPPAGAQVIGYISEVIAESPTPLQEWTVDAEFGLPPAADGGASAAPFPVTIADGWRAVSAAPNLPATRPLDCTEGEGKIPIEALISQCYVEEGKTLGVSDLKIQAPKTTTAFPGAQAKLTFGLDAASSVAPPPSFGLGGTTTLRGASVSISERVFTPGKVGGASFRAPLATRQLRVTVPKKAKPGTYEVTLTGTAPGGGAVTATTTLKVILATVKLVGRPKLNERAGTAVLNVKVPGAGSLTVSGKGIIKAKKTAKKAKVLKLTVRAKGGVKAALLASGSARLKPKLSFKPVSGATTTKSSSLTLKLR